MMKSIALATLLAMAGSAHAADGPWPSDRWRADVTETRQGHVLRATLVGVETHTTRGTKVTVTCSTDGARITHGTGYALMRQDDFEGGVPGAGSFGIHMPGRTLTWFDGHACAKGEITWHRL